VYGQTDYKTPHLDKLAAQGIRFNQAYANSAVCSATRFALITGRYQYRLRGGLEEPIAGASDTIGLPPSHPTLPSLLKKQGYGTALIGKWHLGYLPTFGPLKSGYDSFFGNYGGAIDYFTHKPGVGPNVKEDLYEGEVPVQQIGYYTDLLGARAVDFVNRQQAGKPFLLSLHYTAPHWPWEGPGDEEISRDIDNIFHYDGGDLATYGRMVESLDASIGRVLAALEKKGLAENTIVIFTSDNGGERFSKTWPLTGQKTELLEGGIRVPAIVRWPAKVKAGQVSEQVAISMDWLPTLLAAAGGAPIRNTRPMARTCCRSCRASTQQRAHAAVALQGQCPARDPLRQLEIPEDRQERIPVRCGEGPARARQPRQAPSGSVREAEGAVGNVGQGHAADHRRRPHPRRQRQSAS
jgi:arylsulfatase A-like enzyme